MLRPWLPADAPALVEACQDPALRRWASLPLSDEADGLRWVESQRQGWTSGDRFSFAVLEAQHLGTHRQLLGHVALKAVARGKPSAEVGYWTAAHARGRGVAPRALQALADWAFHTFGAHGLRRLELLHQLDNQASCRVAEKTRFSFDRVLPAAPPAFPLDGHLHVLCWDGARARGVLPRASGRPADPGRPAHDDAGAVGMA
ncbi:GNAT family N-acetyltransferase [Streptomyces endophytica]|uniref:GNAT family N-acetyltransferase n=1 Tax=Streptomyces endophytica TaxID=2991496 RepID=A0ABY6PJR5_9ACTN|nr:GNAT family N-acetyltransferase [Streptomyces endophytica]UZJ34154.1 GNAT family N-acetyltransferase [Streptomyces endophytica]